jgi:hypothetical protein
MKMSEAVSEIMCRENPDERFVFVIGAGHFGARAARILSEQGDVQVFVVDQDENRLSGFKGPRVKTISSNGLRFLSDHFPLLNLSSLIVPALPVHLAAEWVRLLLEEDLPLKKIDLPDELKSLLPHTWPAEDGSLLVSYADYLCPEDCAEPRRCTVTGEERRPLYELLGSLTLSDYRVHIVQSHQLAPGLGGYLLKDLFSCAEKIQEESPARWILGTACRCHGVLSGLWAGRKSDRAKADS